VGSAGASFSAEADWALAAIMTALVAQEGVKRPARLAGGDAGWRPEFLIRPKDWGLSMDLLPQVLAPLLIIGGIVYLFTRRNRERARNAQLRGEIEMRVCFETTLDRVSILGTDGFRGGTRGMWISVRGPKRLIVGTDAFMISAPRALREFVFRGPESSIAFGQAVNPDDCIMITGQADDRRVQLAITGDNLQDIWQALAGTGAALLLRIATLLVTCHTARGKTKTEIMCCLEWYIAREVFPLPVT
jgi:hypothetical protein